MAGPAPHRIQRFEVLAVLGAGGMGTVYRARDPQLERDVAIKVLTSSVPAAVAISPGDTIDLRGDSPASQHDLLREARMMARLSHPNVLPVYEVGLADDSLFVVMEHIAGEDLENWLGKPRTTVEILGVFAQAGRGLLAAHDHGIVHRDFKPANVLIGRDGRARVADFGLSKLTARPANTMVHVDDGRGTPRYMAPELWHGAVATLASDVYAYCAALDGALGDPHKRELTRAQREAIAAGLADDPAARPPLGAILAVLGRKTPRRRWLVAGAVGAIAGGVGFAIALRSDTAPSCEVGTSLFDGRWDPARRDALKAHLLAIAPKAAVQVDRIAATLDDKRREIEDGMQATCAALQSGELTEAQARVRASCFERRAYVLGAVVASTSRRHDALGTAETNAQIAVADCVEIDAPPLPSARGPAIALWYRFHVSRALGVEGRIEELRVLERDAASAGEVELAARTAYVLGVLLHGHDKLAEADDALQRAYRLAVDLRSSLLQAAILSERSFIATRRNDATGARGFAELALEIAARPTTPPTAKASVYNSFARAALQAGDPRGAIEKLDKSLEVSRASHLIDFEITARMLLFQAHVVNYQLNHAEASRRMLGKLAAETVEVARTSLGEHAENYALALLMLATTRDGRDGIATYREALAILRELHPEDHTQVVATRLAIARGLARLADYEQARVEYEGLLAVADRHPAVRGMRPDIRGALGRTLFELGEFDAGLRQMQLALEEYQSNNPSILGLRRQQIACELSLERIDDAAHHIAALEETYRGQAQPHDKELAYVHGMFSAEVVRLRGKPKQAEKMTREALALTTELQGGDAMRADLLEMLGATLGDQRRWKEARAAYVEARRLGESLHLREVNLAQYDAEIARVDLALGRRAAAIERARRAKLVLDRWPSAIGGRASVAKVLDAAPKSKSTRRPPKRSRR